MKHLTEPFSVAWSCFALPFETWKIQGLENGPRLVLFIDLFFWYLQSPLRMTVLLLFKLDQIEQETSASCSFFFFFFYIFFSSSKHWELKSIDFGMGRMVGKPKVLLGFLADLKMSQLYNETLMRLVTLCVAFIRAEHDEWFISI